MLSVNSNWRDSNSQATHWSATGATSSTTASTSPREVLTTTYAMLFLAERLTEEDAAQSSAD